MFPRDRIRAAINAGLGACSKRVRALIDQAHSLSEREVLAAGRSIDQMHREAQGNLDSLQRVGRQLESSDAEVLSTMKRNASVMHGHAERLADGMGRQRASATAVTEVARKITTFVAGVEQVSMELKMLTLNARLEAARWGSQGAAFATVASSMGALTGEVAKANQHIGDLAAELREIAKQVADNQQMVEALTGGLTGDVEAQIAALAGAYQSAARVSAEAVSAGAERGARLVTLSLDVLGHLQFQDRMSQVLRETQTVVEHGEKTTGELLAIDPERADGGGLEAAIEGVVAGAGKVALRISGESELASSDAALQSGVVEMF